MNEKLKKTLSTSIISVAIITGLVEYAKRENEKSQILVDHIPPKDFSN